MHCVSLTGLTIITIVNIYLKWVKQFAQIQTTGEIPIMTNGVVSHTMQLVGASYAVAVGKRNYFMRKEFLLLFLIGICGRFYWHVCWIIISIMMIYNVF